MKGIQSQIKTLGKSGAAAKPIIEDTFSGIFLANFNIIQPPIDDPINICFFSEYPVSQTLLREVNSHKLFL